MHSNDMQRIMRGFISSVALVMWHYPQSLLWKTNSAFPLFYLGSLLALIFQRTAYWQRICLQYGKPEFNPWVGKIPWRREWLPTPVFLPEEFFMGREAWQATVDRMAISWT